MRTLTFRLPSGLEYVISVPLEDDEYYWEEGNGSCDCNRILELERHYPDIDFGESECGEKIDLIHVDPPWSETRTVED